MFEDSLMESGGKIRTNQKTTTTISFIVELIVIGFMVLLPLLITEALPLHQLNSFLVAPPPPPPPPPPPAAVVKQVPRTTEVVNNELRTPSKIPKVIKMIKEEDQPAPSAGVVGGVAGGVPGGQLGGVIGSIVGSSAPPPKVATPQKLRVSQGVAEGNLVHRVEPQYPQMAKVAHIQGEVLLAATISKNGAIENLHAISGHPILAQAAMDAVKQWKYKPYLLNGEAVEVETTVKVSFHM